VRMLAGEPDRTVVATCTEKITAALDPTDIKVEGAYDDPNGSHITIYCVSEAFEGKRSLARQQLIFKEIWDVMEGQGGA
jgi:acid stress-induced BolA-like protein IbaG/YrbA